MDHILNKWDTILKTLKTEYDISEVSFNTWIKPLEVYGVDGDILYILVPAVQMTLNYISKKYSLPLKVVIAEITGIEYEIKFILPEQVGSIQTNSNKEKKKTASPATEEFPTEDIEIYSNIRLSLLRSLTAIAL